MIRLSTLFCMVMIQLCCTAENAYARRGISIPIFSDDDERLVYAKTCLASIDERLRANVGKNE